MNYLHDKTGLSKLRKELRKYSDSKKAQDIMRFFKTGKGQYGEGDIFIGVTVPELRRISKKYLAIDKSYILELLSSKIHEERMVAILILISWFDKGNLLTRESIYKLYLNNIIYINNWDLVDLSAPKILGAFLSDKSRDILYKLAVSENIWKRRIAIISTLYFIKNGQYEDTIQISKILLNDSHDLIHKAVGWMLRETGKKCSEEILKDFLNANYKKMPRTMLRYAIERFPAGVREKYLNNII